MNLKDLARPYPWRGVTLYFLPYRPLAVDAAIRALETVEPHYEYVHSGTGEHRASKPDDLLEAEQQAESRAKVTRKPVTPKSDWAQVDLWDIRHTVYAVVMPTLVAIDFPSLNGHTPAELSVFAALWQERDLPVAQRWPTFKAALSTEVNNALSAGYNATRDHALDGDAALQSEPEADASADEKKDDTPPSERSADASRRALKAT